MDLTTNPQQLNLSGVYALNNSLSARFTTLTEAVPMLSTVFLLLIGLPGNILALLALSKLIKESKSYLMQVKVVVCS